MLPTEVLAVEEYKKIKLFLSPLFQMMKTYNVFLG